MRARRSLEEAANEPDFTRNRAGAYASGTPGCASLALRFESPIAAAQTLDQRTYALLNTYAAILEEAADIVRDPAVPLAVKRALGDAERAATPAVEAAEAAFRVYAQARGDERAAASHRLEEAVDQAKPAVDALQQLVRDQR